ncbi:MAG: GAF domain-containing protein [Anaerolineae bacterium]|nr:GAF domain-containing protein [Anaerolineae bacterium]
MRAESKSQEEGINLEDLLSSIASSAVRLVKATGGGVYLYRPEEDVLEWRAVAGESAVPLGSKLRRGEGVTGLVWETGKPVYVEDYQRWGRRAAQYDGLPIGAVIGVPVKWGDNFLGALLVEHREPARFSESDIELLSLFAPQAALAIYTMQLYERERKQASSLAVVNQVASKMLSILDLSQLLREAVTAIQQGFGYYNVTLLLLDEATNTLGDQVMAGGLAHLAPPDYRQEVGVGLIGWAAATGEPLVVNDVSQDPRYIVGFDIAVSTRSELCVPLKLGGRVIGVLDVQDTRLNAFDETDLTVLGTLADQLATAIANARLYESERREREWAEALAEAAAAINSTLELDEVLDRILVQVERVIGGDACNIMLLESDNLVRPVRWRGYDKLGREKSIATAYAQLDKYATLRTMMETGKPLLITDTTTDPLWVQQDDPEWLFSYVAAPIRVGGLTVGFLNVDSTRRHQFDLQDAQRLEAFASHVATAIANARLYEHARKQLEGLTNLIQASQLLASSLEVREVLRRIVELAGSVVNSDYTSVILVDERGQFLMEAEDFRGIPPLSHRIRSDGVTRYILESGQSLVGDIISEDGLIHPPIYRPDGTPRKANPIMVTAGIRSFAAAPIRAKGRVLGVLFAHSRKPYAFRGQLAVLTAFANQAAVALENARLFGAEQEQRELAEALGEAASAIASLDFEEVLDRVLEQVERVVPGDVFRIMLVEGTLVRVVRERGCMGLVDQAAGLVIPVAAHPLLGKMMRTGKPIVVLDTYEEPDLIVALQCGELARSYVGAPIIVDGNTVGFLEVNSLKPGRFDLADARRLAIFAAYVATALRNARLYQAVRDYAELLEERVRERTAQLAAQYRRAEAILHSTADGIVVLGEGGEILQLNPVARAWLDRLPEGDRELVLTTAQELAVRAAERPATVLELSGLDLEVKATPISETLEKPLQPLSGEPRAVVVLHDISELKALDRMKTTFVKNASHELRTPLTTVKLYTHLLRQVTPGDENWRVYLEALAQEVDEQARLIEDILYLSRIYSGYVEKNLQREPIPVDELTGTVFIRHHPVAQDKGVHLEHRSLALPGQGEAGPTATVDATQTVIALGYLVDSAIRYTPPGGRVTIGAALGEQDGRPWVALSVSDTGEAIPEADLPRAFDRLFREGDTELQSKRLTETGLRLMIVKELVSMQGGWITVESRAGEGNTFTIWLPLDTR